jgi:hypothetical protein
MKRLRGSARTITGLLIFVGTAGACTVAENSADLLDLTWRQKTEERILQARGPDGGFADLPGLFRLRPNLHATARALKAYALLEAPVPNAAATRQMLYGALSYHFFDTGTGSATVIGAEYTPTNIEVFLTVDDAPAVPRAGGPARAALLSLADYVESLELLNALRPDEALAEYVIRLRQPDGSFRDVANPGLPPLTDTWLAVKILSALQKAGLERPLDLESTKAWLRAQWLAETTDRDLCEDDEDIMRVAGRVDVIAFALEHLEVPLETLPRNERLDACLLRELRVRLSMGPTAYLHELVVLANAAARLNLDLAPLADDFARALQQNVAPASLEQGEFADLNSAVFIATLLRYANGADADLSDLHTATKEWLDSLAVPTGGFRSPPGRPVPGPHTTAYALRALRRLNSEHANDPASFRYLREQLDAGPEPSVAYVASFALDLRQLDDDLQQRIADTVMGEIEAYLERGAIPSIHIAELLHVVDQLGVELNPETKARLVARLENARGTSWQCDPTHPDVQWLQQTLLTVLALERLDAPVDNVCARSIVAAVEGLQDAHGGFPAGTPDILVTHLVVSTLRTMGYTPNRTDALKAWLRASRDDLGGYLQTTRETLLLQYRTPEADIVYTVYGLELEHLLE